MVQQVIRPGMFGKTVCADTRRGEFDWKNEQLLAQSAPPDVVFIGDSITQLWELPCWFSTANRMVNRGISGDEMRYIAQRFEADVVQLHPRCCVLLGGINDSWGLEYDPAAFTGGEPFEQLLNRVKSYFDTVIGLALNANLKLALCSVLPVHMPYKNCDAQRNEYICQLNQYLRCMCERNGLIYVDYHTAMFDDTQKCMRDGFTYEGLHPNPEGYRRMAQVLRQTLAAIDVVL